MKKHICVVTATRAEYGLLGPIIKKIENDKELCLSVVVTGMHLSPEFGLTYQEIEKDGIHIEKKIEILLSADTPAAISKSMGVAMMGFADYFAEVNPDAVILLGDRYEILAVACSAMNEHIPIIHLHGGETTEGLIDEAIRHSITKMSYLHFTSTESYRRRVIQMGENPDRVFNVGAMGVENVYNTELYSLSDLEKSIGYKLGNRYAVGTFHPVTLENATAEKQMVELLKALDKNSNIKYLFTKANADTNGRVINELLEDYANKHNNVILVDSLGMRKYLSALKYAMFVIGNSSSGLIEAPSFHIPTINIGDRQKGRIAGDTIIQCEPEIEAIDKAIHRALSEEFRDKIAGANNPYGDGNTSDKIIEIVKAYVLNNKINIKKEFYNIEF